MTQALKGALVAFAFISAVEGGVSLSQGEWVFALLHLLEAGVHAASLVFLVEREGWL